MQLNNKCYTFFVKCLPHRCKRINLKWETRTHTRWLICIYALCDSATLCEYAGFIYNLTVHRDLLDLQLNWCLGRIWMYSVFANKLPGIDQSAMGSDELIESNCRVHQSAINKKVREENTKFNVPIKIAITNGRWRRRTRSMWIDELIDWCLIWANTQCHHHR